METLNDQLDPKWLADCVGCGVEKIPRMKMIKVAQLVEAKGGQSTHLCRVCAAEVAMKITAQMLWDWKTK